MGHPGPPATHPVRRHPLVPLLLLLMIGPLTAVSTVAADDLRGTLVVVGRGPERPVIEQLSRAFENAHVRTAVDIKWNRNLRITDRVKSGEADLAVSDMDDPDLIGRTIAWDGIAVIVNFSSPVKELTTQQLRDVFTGAVTSWSELHERAEGPVELILRPDDQNVAAGFEQSLGVTGKLKAKAQVIRLDQKVLSRVSGRLGAIGYMSLAAALDAVKYGMPIRILLIDGIEPGEPTVKFRQYKLKRPVIFLTPKRPNPIAQAFVEFALSPAGQRILDEMYVSLAH